ncbi:MAG: hypothetical protein H0T51_17970 [Pirellulales bacterium]|nr:hypothetical protein [Pirellulales bacterium]
MSAEPLHVIRFGLIKCEIHLRQTRSGDRFNVLVSRLFRNGDQWHESKQFGRDDLPLLAKVVDLAHTWIYLQGQSAGSSVPSDCEVKHG